MRLSNVRAGFTLAEVLITLGIIGVVAAMTMPTLMNQTNGAQYKAAYKKALSAISQAITLNVALDDKSFADATDEGTAGKYAENKNTVADFLAARMNVVNGTTKIGYKTDFTAVDGATNGESNTSLFFNDGIVFQFNPKTAKACTSPNSGKTVSPSIAACSGFIDVNGEKGPNKVISCKGEKANCEVDQPTDIYPVVFFDQTILPSTPAGRAVLYGK